MKRFICLILLTTFSLTAADRVRVAINGFGRIGKNLLRGIMLDPKARERIDIVAINIGRSSAYDAAHLFKYDTLLGSYSGTVYADDDKLVVDGYAIKLISELDVEKLPWKELDVDWVVDCSGTCRHRDKAMRHCAQGAGKVLISAPGYDDDITVVLGVNDDAYDPEKHCIVSLGSCTTNALLPVLKVLNDNFSLEKIMVTTVHAMTSSQKLLDGRASDLRSSRAAGLNIIPHSTGVAKAAPKVIPSLEGKLMAVALRVPVPHVSMIDVTFEVKESIDREQLNRLFTTYAQSGSLEGILGVTFLPLVSSDFAGINESVIVDGMLTQVHGQLGKVFAWYDNEWGYSQRLKDFLVCLG